MGKNFVKEIIKVELAQFKKSPLLIISVIFICLVPIFYTTVFIYSIWDPYGRFDNMRAGLVTLDKGMALNGKFYNLGQAIVETLKTEKPFKFSEYKTEEEARAAVVSGRSYFSLVVPPDFTEMALPGTSEGTLRLYTAGGSNYVASLTAQKLTEKVAEGLNRQLGQERWKIALQLKSGFGLFRTKEKPEYLVSSSKFEEIKLDPVTVNGQGFSPYFMALSIWVGTLVAGFLFKPNTLPSSLRDADRRSKILGKLAVPLTISAAGGLVLAVFMHFIPQMPVIHPIGYYVVIFSAVLMYGAVIFSLNTVLNDAGKLLSLLFLVVQLAAAGGVYPIDLEPRIYRLISPLLPLTSVLNGLRAAMFGSFNGHWLLYVVYMIPWIAAGAFLMVLGAGRFNYEADDIYGPAVRLPSFNKRS